MYLQSINSTDAFVEVRFLETVDKTDVITSLNPVWNSEQFAFDTDEKELTEEWLQLRYLDRWRSGFSKMFVFLE